MLEWWGEQMLNSLLMSEGETAVMCAKVHDIRNRYRYTSSLGRRSWNMLKWTWHSCQWTDVNPGQIITSVREQTFFHLISVFWKVWLLPEELADRTPPDLFPGKEPREASVLSNRWALLRSSSQREWGGSAACRRRSCKMSLFVLL